MALASGCRGEPGTENPGLSLTVHISPTPPTVAPTRIIIILTDSLGAPVDGAEIRVEGNMSHAGMKPVLASAEAEGSGQYSVPDFTFTMAGDWTLTVEATLPDGRMVRTLQETRVVATMERRF